MSPTNEAAEVPPPIPVARGEDRLTDDYCRDGMVVFEVCPFFAVRISSVADLAFRLRTFSSASPNVSSSPVRESSNPCFLVREKRAKPRMRVTFPCLT